MNIVTGWMNTPAEDAIQRRFHGATDGWLEEAAAAQPFGRLIEPEEIARTIAFPTSRSSGVQIGRHNAHLPRPSRSAPKSAVGQRGRWTSRRCCSP